MTATKTRSGRQNGCLFIHSGKARPRHFTQFFLSVCAYHWHFVLWPEQDGDLSAFMQQMTNKHVKRWKEHFHETGLGHLYQGRFKSFPVQTDEYFYQAVRYVERNALRANLVSRAQDWPWSSLARCNRLDDLTLLNDSLLSQWPIPGPTIGYRS